MNNLLHPHILCTRSGCSSSVRRAINPLRIRFLCLTSSRAMETELLRQQRALGLYEQASEKESTGLMRDAIDLYKSAIKVSFFSPLKEPKH